MIIKGSQPVELTVTEVVETIEIFRDSPKGSTDPNLLAVFEFFKNGAVRIAIPTENDTNEKVWLSDEEVIVLFKMFEMQAARIKDIAGLLETFENEAAAKRVAKQIEEKKNSMGLSKSDWSGATVTDGEWKGKVT